MKKSNNITTILGIIGAIVAAIKPLYENGDIDLHRDWFVLLQAAGLAVFSYFVKDIDFKQGESRNIPRNEKINTVAGQDTSERESSSPQGVEDNNENP